MPDARRDSVYCLLTHIARQHSSKSAAPLTRHPPHQALALRLNGTDIVATQYADGRVLRLDCRVQGRDRSYLFVCVPDKAAERVPFLAGFPACIYWFEFWLASNGTRFGEVARAEWPIRSHFV